MAKPCMFVANWKMQFSYLQAIDFCRQHGTELDARAKAHGLTVVLCPTIPALPVMVDVLRNTSILLGAQDCSRFKEGPYTGEISARSIAEVGCSYCVVGHSERRRHVGETDAQAAEKIGNLLAVGVVPILCVGETYEERCQKNTIKVIEEHLYNLTVAIRAAAYPVERLVCAYEPVWAVGTGCVADCQDIAQAIRVIKEWFARECPQVKDVICLYGGSVNEKNIAEIRSIDLLGGFLVGAASLDFQKFKNMLSYDS